MELICGHEGKHHAKGLCSPCYEFARHFLKKKRDLDKQHGKEMKKLKAQMGELGLVNHELLEALKKVHHHFTVFRPELVDGEIATLLREIKESIDKKEGTDNNE